MLRQQLGDLLGLAQGTHERDHDLDVGQAHFIAHALERLAFHGERLGKVLAHVARSTAEAQHRVFFFRLVAAAADQLAVFVALEVGHAHDHRLGPEGRADGGHAFGNLVHVEGTRRRMATGHGLDRLLQVGIDIRVVDDGLGVHADVVVDDELEAGQTHAAVGQLAEVEGQLGVAHVHHDLGGDLGHGAAFHFGHFHFQQAVVDVAGVAFGAAHGHQGTVLERFGGVMAAHHGRDAQLTRDDGGVAGTAATVGHDGAGALHHRFPVGVGHVGHQHVAGLHGIHFAGIVHQTHRAGTDLLANGTAFGQHGALALELVAVFDLAFALALHRLGTGLQDVELAVGAVLAPLDVHRAAIVLLDHQCVASQLLDFGVGQGIAVAQFGRHVFGAHQLAAGSLLFGRGKHHLDQLAAQVATDQCLVAGLQHGLVHVELVGVDGTLHHGFTQAVAGGDEHDITEAGLGIHGEHHAGSAQVGAHHALHAGRQSHFGVGKALVHAVADGTVVVQAGEHFLDLVQHGLDAHHVQEGFLLAGEGGVRQIFCGGGRTHGEAGLVIAAAQGGEGVADALFQIGRERLVLDHGTDFGAGDSQGVDVIGVQCIKLGIDARIQAVVLEELAERVGRGGKTRGDANALGQLGDHLAQAGILAADGVDVLHAEFLERNDQVGRIEKCRHCMLQKLNRCGAACLLVLVVLAAPKAGGPDARLFLDCSYCSGLDRRCGSNGRDAPRLIAG